jgi:hypothetical protein
LSSDCALPIITVYQINSGRWVITPNDRDKIHAIMKDCTNCEWTSHPQVVPEALE